ncbi:MAG: hypothetical protein L3K07_01175 [Thermoplasmata archaeon]|nr:hypothetical protein [Thermoplasmata archaeon]
MRLAREGGTELLLPPVVAKRGPARRAAVFYNPAMSLDRDIGVAVLTAWGRARNRKVAAWEMLAATGVRGLRLLVESRALESLDLTEANPAAFEVLSSNAARYAGQGAKAVHADALLEPPRAGYGYVELDPYGSPLPFLASAIRALAPDGLLGVTATDLMVLAGPQPAVCERKYGAHPLHGWLGPEGGLRILLATLSRAARKAQRGFRPRLAYVLGHHLRVYAELPPGGGAVLDPIHLVPGDPTTGPTLGGTGPFGPLWTGPIFDQEFLSTLGVPSTAAEPRPLARLLARWREEREADTPFAYEPNRVAAALGLPKPPPLGSLLEELRARGFLAARSHLTASAFRTTAPREEVEAAAREVARRLDPTTPRTTGSSRTGAPPS